MAGEVQALSGVLRTPHRHAGLVIDIASFSSKSGRPRLGMMLSPTHDRVGLSGLAFRDAQYVAAIFGLLERAAELAQLFLGDEAAAIGDLLEAGDLGSLPFLHHMHELRGLEQRVMRARIEPGIAVAELLDRELAALEIGSVHIGDLVFAARRWLERGRDVENMIVVEIEARHRPMRLRVLRLLDDVAGAPAYVEADDAVALRMLDPIGEHRSSAD